MTALSFYKLMQLMGVPVIKNHADYRLMSHSALNALDEFGEVNLFLRAMILELGFKKEFVYFNVKDRFAGESKYSITKMISFALNGITSFSVAPLRLVTISGFFVFSLSVIMGLYILITAILKGNIVPGWASTVLPIYVIGGIQLIGIGVIGEYIGKIYKEIKKRPRYIIESDLQ